MVNDQENDVAYWRTRAEKLQAELRYATHNLRRQMEIIRQQRDEYWERLFQQGRV